RFEFEINEDSKCVPNIPKAKVSFSQIVAEISPAKNEENVIVGVEPIIALNFPLDREIKIEGTNKVRFKLDYVQMYEGTGTSKPVDPTYKLINDNLDIAVKPREFLRANNTRYTFK